jgi:hypothetical protein
VTTFRHVEQPVPVYIPKGIAFTSDLPWFAGDAPTPTAPTSATYTLRNASGTAVISAQAATITGSVATYAIGSSVLDAQTYGAHWQEEWAITYGGVAYAPIVRRASLCRRELVCPVSTRSIQLAHPELVTYPAGDSSWSALLEDAWTWVLQQIEATGRRPYLVVGSDTLYRVTLYAALGRIFRSLSTYAGDAGRFAELATHYDANETSAPGGAYYTAPGLAQQAWASWRADYDTDDDGQVQSDESDALIHGPGWAW